MTNDRTTLGDETVRVVVYGGAADRYITLHFDPRRFCALHQIRYDMLIAWNNEHTLYN